MRYLSSVKAQPQHATMQQVHDTLRKEQWMSSLYATARRELLDIHDSVSWHLLSMGQQMKDTSLHSKDCLQSGEFFFGIPSADSWCTDNNITSPDDRDVGLCPFGVDIQGNPTCYSNTIMKLGVIHCEVVQSNCGRYYPLSEVRQYSISRTGTAITFGWVLVIRESLFVVYVFDTGSQ